MGKHFQPITVEPYFRCINHGQIVSMNDVCLIRTYLGIGEKMLNPARNFLMVPPALNQLCRFSCWALRNSLLRCFHCCAVNVLRILETPKPASA